VKKKLNPSGAVADSIDFSNPIIVTTVAGNGTYQAGRKGDAGVSIGPKRVALGGNVG
jgi:hypothetical protein